jgi:hypothetical protein
MAKTIQEILTVVLISIIKIFTPPAQAGWKRSHRTNDLKGR